MPGANSSLGNRLGELLRLEKLPPPAGFSARAEVTDPAAYERVAADPPAWWAAQARERLHWDTPFCSVLDDGHPPFYTWFADGTINASYNCLDRHVLAGRGGRVAFHWRGAHGEERDLTYAELSRDVQRLANALKAQGIRKGDIVGIYLPMIPETVVTMLACARIGAPHAVVSGCAPGAVRERLAASRAKALIVADGVQRRGKLVPVKYQMDKVISDLPELETVVVVRSSGADCLMRPGRDVWFDDLLASARPLYPAEPMEAEHPLFLLYPPSSAAGPAGVVHSTGGYLAGVTATTAMVFDLDADYDIFWCTAEAGRITGHSYVVYGPLANGCTSVMFEGDQDYPDKDIWWEIVERYGVTILHTATAAIRACMRWGAKHPAKRDLSSLRLLGSAGEPADPEAWVWYHTVIGGERCPVVDSWCQPETGAIMISTPPGMPAKPGSAGRPLPGVSAAVLDGSGGEADQGGGVLALTRPWPSMLRTLYREPDRYARTYFGGSGPLTYISGDGARRDEDGYFWITGRAGKPSAARPGTSKPTLARDPASGQVPGNATTLRDASLLSQPPQTSSPASTGDGRAPRARTQFNRQIREAT